MESPLTTETNPDPAANPWRTAEWVTLLAVWAVVREVQVTFGTVGFGGGDLFEYAAYARAWAEGHTPYVDYVVEYPPGALLLFLVPWLMGGREHFIKAFLGEMAVFDLLALVGVVLLARRLFPESRARQRLAAGVYLLATVLLQPVLYSRFDLAPSVLALAALYLAAAGSGSASAFLLGLGGAVKLWPLALAPLWLGEAYRRGGSQRALRVGTVMAAGYLAPMLLLLPRAGGKVTAFLQFHAARGIQIESTWAALMLGLNKLGLLRAAPLYEYGAWDVQSPASGFLAALSIPLLVAAVLLPQVLALRAGAWSERDPRGEVALRGATAGILGLLVAAKVLSPQFMLWVAAPLALSGAGLSALLVVASLLTSLLYPLIYPALLDPRTAGHGLAVSCLLLRDGLLWSAYILLLKRLGQARTVPV